LGPTINTSFEEACPRISPVGNSLFFQRRDQWQNAASSDIYRVDMAVLRHAQPMGR
jgi:hypothetical protein